MLTFSADLMETLSSCKYLVLQTSCHTKNHIIGIIGINVEYDVWNMDRSNDTAMERMICYYVRFVTALIINVSEEVDWK